MDDRQQARIQRKIDFIEIAMNSLDIDCFQVGDDYVREYLQEMGVEWDETLGEPEVRYYKYGHPPGQPIRVRGTMRRDSHHIPPEALLDEVAITLARNSALHAFEEHHRLCATQQIRKEAGTVRAELDRSEVCYPRSSTATAPAAEAVTGQDQPLPFGAVEEELLRAFGNLDSITDD